MTRQKKDKAAEIILQTSTNIPNSQVRILREPGYGSQKQMRIVGEERASRAIEFSLLVEVHQLEEKRG